MLLMRMIIWFVPDQGSNVWTDGMVITKKCKSTKLAHQFIDYFLNYDVAEQNTDYIGYDSAVKVCMNILKNDAYAGNPGCGPDTSNPKNEVFKDQPQDIKAYSSSLLDKS